MNVIKIYCTEELNKQYFDFRIRDLNFTNLFHFANTHSFLQNFDKPHVYLERLFSGWIFGQLKFTNKKNYAHDYLFRNKITWDNCLKTILHSHGSRWKRNFDMQFYLLKMNEWIQWRRAILLSSIDMPWEINSFLLIFQSNRLTRVTQFIDFKLRTRI